MKRRSFLQLLGLAPAAAALPALAKVATPQPYPVRVWDGASTRRMTALEIRVQQNTRYTQRVDLNYEWQAHTIIDDTRNGKQYEYAELFNSYNYPTQDERAAYVERALWAFRRKFKLETT